MDDKQIPKWFWKLAASVLVSAAVSMGYGGFAMGEFTGTVKVNHQTTEKRLSQIDERLGGIEHRLRKYDLYFTPQPQLTHKD